MFNLDKFIADCVINRSVSMFAADIEANKEKLSAEIRGKKVCVIGGAGSIGSSFIKAVLRFEPKSVVVVDLNENGLAISLAVRRRLLRKVMKEEEMLVLPKVWIASIFLILAIMSAASMPNQMNI